MAKKHKSRKQRRVDRTVGGTQTGAGGALGVLLPSDSATITDRGPTKYYKLRTGESVLPNWFVYLALSWFPLVALMAVYGHKYGYSPDLHMSSLIQFGGPALLTMLLVLQRRSGLAIYRPVILLPALLFAAWALLSVVWAINEYEASVKILDWGGAVLAGLLISHVLRHWGDVRLFINIVLGVAVMLLFLGYMQYLFDVQWVDQHVSPSMTFNNKNMAAQYTLLLLPIGLVMGLCAKSWWSLLLYLGIAAAAILFVMVGVTRGAIIGMIGEFICLFFLFVLYSIFHRINVAWIVLACCVALLLLFLLLLYVTIPDKVTDLMTITETTIRNFASLSGESRFPIWLNSFAMIRDHLVSGVGAGNWMVYYPKYHTSVLYDNEVGLERQHINAHQDYLEMTAELGLVGLGLLLWFMLSIAWITVRLIARIRTHESFIIIGLTTAIFGLLVNSLASFGMQQPLPFCMVMIYAGVLDYYWRTQRDVAPLGIFKSRHSVNIPTVLAGTLCVSMLLLNIAWYRSEIHYRQALISTNKHVNALLYHGAEALKWAPGRTRTVNFIARAYAVKGDREKALQAYDTLLSDYPYMLHALDNAAIAYKRFGLRERARDTYIRLVEARPRPLIFMRAGQQMYSMGYIDDGVKYIRKGLSPWVEEGRPEVAGALQNRRLEELVHRYDAQVAEREERLRTEAAARNALSSPTATVDDSAEE